jgi:hypothetical protein
LTVTACSQVPPSPEALDKGIAVLDTAGAARCQLLNKTDVFVDAGSGVLERVPADVEQDLRNLAINEAASAGGDSVAPLTPMANGKQTYGIYRCQTSAAPVKPTPAPTPATAAVKTLPYKPPY